MNFPASQKEIEFVNGAIIECRDCLARAAIEIAELHSYLDENYLAIDVECKKELDRQITDIESKMWALKIMLVKMRNNPERIIKKESWFL